MPGLCRASGRRRGSGEYREGYAEAQRAHLIGRAVRDRRLTLGLSQVELAARAAWSWKNERGFTTTLELTGRDGKQQRASLGVLYAASGLGARSAAPEGAGTLYVMRKRIRQHAETLRGLMAYLDEGDADALFEWCAR